MIENERISKRLILVLAIIMALVGFLFMIPFNSVAENVISETRNVDIFHSVDFRGLGDLHLTQGKESGLRLEGERDLLDKCKTYVENGQLIIELDTWQKIWRRKSINVYITMPAVKGLRINGSGNIIGKSRITSDRLVIRVNGSGDIDLEIEAKELESRISGSGEIRLKGVVKSHEYQISGSGDLKGYDLVTENLKIKISGSGKCEVFVSNKLDVKVSGSGKVYYRGNPKIVNQRISQSGTIRKVD